MRFLSLIAALYALAPAASAFNAPRHPKAAASSSSARGTTTTMTAEAIKTAAEDGVAYVPGDLGYILEANQEWKKSKIAEDPEFFDKLGVTHRPPYLWIGCADARVPANEIIGEVAGAVFTMRNVANMVVNTDVNLMSALQYAVGVLKVQHIIVCGHYECGGVKASMLNVDHGPPLENWLRNIRDVYRLHREELDSIPDGDARHRRLVELNAVEQCINVFKAGQVQRRRVETSRNVAAGFQPYVTPRIHGLVFDPATGKLKRLRINFEEYVADLRDIYELYEAPEV